MGVPNYQLTTNFSANCQLTTIFLANCQLTVNPISTLKVIHLWAICFPASVVVPLGALAPLIDVFFNKGLGRCDGPV